MAFSPFNPTGISTVSLIGAAQAQGVKVYRLKPGQESLVGQLQISADVQNEILQALGLGKEVAVPQSEVTLGTYNGIGYIIEDPSDGSAAYQIDGGRSGGSSDAPENVVPIPAVPDSTLISILLGSSLRQTGAKLAIDGGGLIVGLVLPAVVIVISVLGILIGLLIILMLLSKAIDDALAKSNPSQSDRVFRHYTNAQQLIYRSQYFLISDSGYTLGGGGVYVADAKAEISRGVSCATLDPLDIVTRFQIPPPPDDPRPSLVTGFLEITEFVKNYMRVESKMNPVG